MAVWRKDFKEMKFTKKTRELLAQLDEPSVSPAIGKQVEKMDLQWWLNNTKPVDARQELERAVGQSVSPQVFIQLVWFHGKLYGRKSRLKPQYNEMHPALDDRQWQQLKLCVEKNLKTLEGLTLEQGIRLIRLSVPCGVGRLNGLPRSLHWWKSESEREFRAKRSKVSE